MAELKNITDVELYFNGEEKKFTVSAKQGDKATRYVRVTILQEDNTEYKIPDGYIAIVNIQKPDRHFCYNECAIQDNKVIIQLTNQALAAAGTAHADVEIRNAANALVLSTQSFEIEIEKSQRDENAILSSNEMTALEDRVQKYIDDLIKTKEEVLKVEEAVKIAEEARKQAETDRVNAESDRQANEAARQQTEDGRQANEAARQQAENDRQTNETARQQAENNRQAKETERQQTESDRQANEAARQQAESDRQANETARQQAEAQRGQDLNEHLADKGIHIEEAEREYWNTILQTAKEYTNGMYEQSTGYTREEISKLVGSAPETLDTLEEIAAVIKENQTIMDTLNAAIGTKANKNEFDSHAGNGTIHITVEEREKWNAAAAKDTIAWDKITGRPPIPTNTNQLTNGAGYITGINKTMVVNALGYTPPAENTWRPVQNNLASGSTTDCLSAAMGKTLKEQVDSKAASGHTHNYAESASAGGAATSANKLNANAGNIEQPIYFKNGVPVKCAHSLGSDVPERAVFTDTTGSYKSVGASGNGDAANWKVITLANGYKIMTGKTTGANYTMNNQYGNAYWAAFSISVPNGISYFDCVNVTPYAGTGLVGVVVTYYNTNKISGFVFSPQSETKNITFHVTIHGTA